MEKRGVCQSCRDGAVSEKTEYPTAKKLRKAREDGQVAHSKDFTQTVLVVAIFGYMLANAEYILRTFGEMMVLPASLLGLGFEDAVDVLISQMFKSAVAIVLPFLGIVIGLGLFIELLQTGMLFSIKTMMPSAKKLNVITNIKNIFAVKNLVEFLKSNIKIVFLSALIYVLLKDAMPKLMTLPEAGVTGVGVALSMLLKSMIINISVGYAIIAVADFAWQRYQHIKGLMMSMEDIKQEYKEAEGDPHIKQQRKHLAQELSQQGAVNSTRKASVVITNPTHFAVALRYVREEGDAPVVVAKGQDLIALKIREIAEENGIPVFEDPPLARSMFAQVSVDSVIPPAFYKAVAELIHRVYASRSPRSPQKRIR